MAGLKVGYCSKCRKMTKGPDGNCPDCHTPLRALTGNAYPAKQPTVAAPTPTRAARDKKVHPGGRLYPTRGCECPNCNMARAVLDSGRIPLSEAAESEAEHGNLDMQMTIVQVERIRDQLNRGG